MQLKQSLNSFVKTRYRVFIYIVAFLIFFGLCVYFNKLFTIKTIDIKGSDTTIYGLDTIKNRNILFSSVKSIQEELYSRNPQISQIEIEKKFPSNLQIHIELYKPAAYLETREGYIELSENGKILAKTNKKEHTIPLIKYYQSLPYQSYQTGDFITYKDIVYSLYFSQKLEDLGIRIINIDITGFYMLRLYNDKNQSFIVTTDKEKELQYNQLSTIIKQLKLKGQAFVSIDVRFDKPIATF